MNNDITQTGPQTWAQLKEQIGEDYFEQYKDQITAPSYSRSNSLMQKALIPDSGFTRDLGISPDYGKSRYDTMQEASPDELYNYEDLRGKRQSFTAKLGAGLSKGAVLAGTTFVDGTLGFAYGLGQALAEGRASAIFDNDLSDALQSINEKLEEVLPNYQTDAEKEQPWWKNALNGSMNFWADSFLKNIGFTVGAFYSGSTMLAGLKAIGAIKSGLAAATVGSVLGGFNEARIEANNGQNDFYKLQDAQIEDAANKQRSAILNDPAKTNEQKYYELNALDKDVEKLKQDALDKSREMGMTTLLGNTVLLTAGNMIQFGKLYSRGFSNARKVGQSVKDGARAAGTTVGKEVEKEMAKEGIETVTENGIKNYLAKETTRLGKAARGVGNAITEGNEELAQAFIQEYAGSRKTYDSPDSYYLALTNPNSELKTKDLLSSLTESFVNTYGNGDKWEEFAIGFLTGAIGMPTVGKVNNSDANTWLGRGRTLGISGGIFGEVSSMNQRENETKAAVDVMNKYMDKITSQKDYFVQNNSFTNAMEGFSEEDNKFEFQNYQNNEDFAAAAMFAKTGRLDDLLDIVNQDYDNMSDEELERIAINTSPNIQIDDDGNIATHDETGKVITGGWRNADGTLMSSTPEGRDKMKEELKKKRDDMLFEINKYVETVDKVRGIGNNSLTEDQTNELAWYNWKVEMFKKRYADVADKNGEYINILKQSIKDYVETQTNLNDELKTLEGEERQKRKESILDQLEIDLSTEDGQNLIGALQNVVAYLDALQKNSDSPLKMGSIISKNPEIFEFMEDKEALGRTVVEGLSGLSSDQYEEVIRDLTDLGRISTAAVQFNERYKEFVENPIKLIQNRQKIDKKQEKIKKAVKEVSIQDKINNAEVPDLVAGIESGDIDLDAVDELFPEEENSVQSKQQGKQKLQEATKIVKTSSRVEDALDDLKDEGIDPSIIEDAKTLVQQSKEIAQSEDELLDITREIYNNPSLLYDEDDPNLDGLTAEDVRSYMQDKLDAAKSVLNVALDKMDKENAELEDLPKPIKSLGQELVNPEKETGHDATTAGESENEAVKKKEEEEAKQQEAQKEYADADNIFDESRAGLPEEALEIFNQTLPDVLAAADKFMQAGMDDEIILGALTNSDSYTTLRKLAPNIGDTFRKYLEFKRSAPERKEALKQQEKVEKKEPQTEIPTPVIGQEDIEKQIKDIRVSNPNSVELPDTYHYWKPNLSWLPFGKAYIRGNQTPLYKLAKDLKNPDGTDMFTESQINRIKAVGAHLDREGAFKRVDSGAVKKGDKVQFIIDSTLNDSAGEIVILMADEYGNPIGDIASINEEISDKQVGLRAFQERIIKEYKDAGSPKNFTSKETSTVDKNMVGKVPFTDKSEMHTLNEIFEGNDFKLGVAVTSGKNARILETPNRRKKQGQSAEERQINLPLTARAGQPYLLLPTSSDVNKYMPVPFLMERYGIDTQNTALGREIHDILEGIATADNNTIMPVINALKNFISVKEIHINYNGDKVRVSIKPNTSDKQVVIYNGLKSADNLVEQLELGLQGQPFQVSRKYMNSTYKGVSYNEMIGEIAKVNLPIGTTHTVSDWFTIRPLNGSGKEMETRSSRSTGRNPFSARPSQIEIPYKDMQLFVNTTTWIVSDGKKIYEGEKANKIKARAFGIYTNKNMQEPYRTDWGFYDPVKDDFVSEPSDEVVKSLGNELISKEKSAEEKIAEKEEPAEEKSTKPLTTTETPEALEQKARDAGLLNSNAREALWKILTPEQQSKIANKKGPRQKQWMDILEKSFNTADNTFNEESLGGSVNEFLNKKALYRATDAVVDPYVKWNKEKEISWLKKVLPNLSDDEHLAIINGLIKINDSRVAWGKFQDGLMTISDIAARGTLYHEAFHAVAHTLFTDEEYQKLYDNAKKIWKSTSDIELEENLAESFRKFMQSEEEWQDSLKDYGKIRQAIAKFFHMIKNIVKSLFGKNHYINKIYYNINRGKYADRVVNPTGVSRFKQEVYTQEMQEIKDEAIADGTYGKVRNKNGELVDSILFKTAGERTWLQVRTKAFKDWFGDWEQIAYDKAELNSIPNLRKINVDSFLKAVDSRLEKDYITTGFLNRESVEVIKKLFDLSKTQLYQGDIKELGLSFYTGAVVLNTMPIEEAVQTFVHEILHSYTTYAYDTDADFKKEINKYHKIALSHDSGFSKDIYEFMANTLEPHHMVALLKIPSENNSSNLLKDIINSFVKHIRTFFKVYETNKKRTLFHDVIETIYNHKRNNSESINNVSKVVDENGEPLVVYHHTDNPNLTEFSTDFDNYFSKDGGTKEAIFFDENKAGTLNRKYDIPVFLNIKDLHEYNETKEQLHQRGTTYRQVINESASTNNIDGGVHMKDFDDNKMEHQNIWIVHNPNQIKSATDNVGTFDPNNPDIRYRMASDFKGSIAEFQRNIDTYVNNSYMYKTRADQNKMWGERVDDYRRNGWIVKGYYNRKSGKWIVTSATKVESESNAYYREVEQYHRDKWMYNNLSQENKDYIKERGISLDEYNEMTDFEKEVFFHCKY